jgi:hypothetical protein
LELWAKNELDGEGGVCCNEAENELVIGRACRILIGASSVGGTNTRTLEGLAKLSVVVVPWLTYPDSFREDEFSRTTASAWKRPADVRRRHSAIALMDSVGRRTASSDPGSGGAGVWGAIDKRLFGGVDKKVGVGGWTIVMLRWMCGWTRADA